MPVTKNPLSRYLIIDRCLRDSSKKGYSKDQLIDKIANLLGSKRVNPKTLYNDLEFIRSSTGFNKEIVELRDADGKTKLYRYANQNDSITNISFSDSDLETICDLAQTLNNFNALPHIEWLAGAVHRLENDIRKNIFGKELPDARPSQPVVEFEQNIDLEGFTDLIPEIYQALKSQRVLLIRYKTFSDKEFQWEIHPYYLKQYNCRWFLFGLNEQKNLTTIAIDRIKSVQYTDAKYIPNNDIDFEDYFYDIIGVSFDPAHPVRTKVLLRFDERRWPYVITKPLHPSQKARDNYTIELDLRINKELIAEILSFGNQVTVLAPEELREEIRSIHEQALTNYL